jgi:hypothetical protein
MPNAGDRWLALFCRVPVMVETLLRVDPTSYYSFFEKGILQTATAKYFINRIIFRNFSRLHGHLEAC